MTLEEYLELVARCDQLEKDIAKTKEEIVRLRGLIGAIRKAVAPQDPSKPRP